MSATIPYVIPATPPKELLAELDAAARSLDDLTARAAQLTLEVDAETLAPRVELREGSGVRRLRPTELLDLLAGA